MLAAQDELVDEKFLALADCLARGAAASPEDDLSITRERLVVAAIRELGLQHMELLRCFGPTTTPSGIQQVTPNGGMVTLDWAALTEAVPSLHPLFHGLLSGLERTGLLSRMPRPDASYDSLGSGEVVWQVTPFGMDRIEQPQAISEAISGPPEL